MNSTIRTTAAVGLLALGASVAFGHSVQRGDEDQLAPGVVKQTGPEARDADNALVAKELGLSIEAVERSIKFQERFTEHAQGLLARYPDQISRIWLEPVPGVAAHVQFTGPVPAEAALENVHLTGNGVISLREHHRRAELASEALRAAGYVNFETSFDAPLGNTRVEMRIAEDAVAPDRADIFDVIQQRIWADQGLVGEALVLAPADVDLRIVRADGEIYDFDHSRGGNWLRDDGVRECTSGWSVDGPNGDGIVTAAHCVGLNQFEEPGLTPYSMTWRDQERGDGDAEYHTTTHWELPEFYATSSSIRDVNSKRWTWLMFPGTTVCVYGRSSNLRSCAHSIEATYVTVTFTDGVTVSDLARASGDTSIGGDSGGGWSYNYTAWGIHSGSNDVDSYFTPIDIAESELGVSLMITP